jgi:hypothetical protein
MRNMAENHPGARTDGCGKDVMEVDDDRIFSTLWIYFSAAGRQEVNRVHDSFGRVSTWSSAPRRVDTLGRGQ